MPIFHKYEAGVIYSPAEPCGLHTPIIVSPTDAVIWVGETQESNADALADATEELRRTYGTPTYTEVVTALEALLHAVKTAGNLLAVMNNGAFDRAGDILARTK